MTADNIIINTLASLSDLAGTVNEGFALAIVSAYMAGVEAGKHAAQKAA